MWVTYRRSLFAGSTAAGLEAGFLGSFFVVTLTLATSASSPESSNAAKKFFDWKETPRHGRHPDGKLNPQRKRQT